MGIPLEILPIYLLHSVLNDFNLLVVDEFLRMNGKNKEEVRLGRDKLLKTIQRFNKLYGFNSSPILCSDFMKLEEYKITFQNVEETIQRLKLTDRVLETVPENKINIASARDYPLHEIACVKFMADKGFSLKIGPSKEKQYDGIMDSLGFNISFAYIPDAYALGTRTPDIVVHYIPNSRGPNNGQRILLDENERTIKAKLEASCDIALRYFCKMASVSGHILGLNIPEEAEINSLYGKKLKKRTIRLVLENIVNPYRSVIK